MRSQPWLLAAALALLPLATAAAQQAAEKNAAAPAAAQAARQPSEAAAATVDGAVITAREVDELLRARLFELRNQEYALRRQALEELIARSVLGSEAAARRVALEELERLEVEAKASPVTEEEAKKVYEANKARLQGRSEQEGLALVTQSMKQDRLRARRVAFVAELRAKHDVRVLLDPPRQDVDLAGAPVRGNPEAPVTIVEFSDFQCPFCGRVVPALKQVLDTYGDRVRLVFRDYPLPNHSQAPKAAEAGACAREQGKFWEMHDRLFANQGALQPDDLKKHAAAIGLDAAAFDACLDSGKHAAVWQKGGEDGNRYGVSGTPAFFINGRMLSGAQPFEAFAELIDDELGRAGIAPPARAPAATPGPRATPTPPAPPK